ncbi:MAG: DUF192 domain-containing protein [Candidatus Woesearchaeota archaeon]
MIRNLTRNTVLAEKFTLCASSLSKAVGLMFSFRPRTLVFVFNNPIRPSLHMLFVFFPIDVVCLDALKRVVAVKEKFRPFTFFGSNVLCNYIIELPAGTIKKSRTMIADNIFF